MFGSAFGFPRYYESPGYYDYPGGRYGGFNGYGRRAQDYPTYYGYNTPYAEMSPNMQHSYGMPVEIPIIREGHDNSVAMRSTGKDLKSGVPEQRRTQNRDTRDRQSSPRHPQDEHNQRTHPIRQISNQRNYPVRQISMTEMDVSDDDDNDNDETYPYYHGMPLNVFGGGFPYTQRNSRSRPQTSELPRSRAPPQTNRAKPQSKSSNAPAEKASSPQHATEPCKSPQHTTEPCKSPTGKPSQNYKSRTVPIAMEEAEEQHAENIPNPVEQLEGIKGEMNDIVTRVDNFAGKKSDKEYIYLDEMITSLLLKLDMIESNGVDEIRNRRRQLVRHVQDCIQKLEQKVGILPTKEEIPYTGNVETTESMEDEANELEDAKNSNMAPLDIPDGEISRVAPVGCQSKADHPFGSSLVTETVISPPAPIDIDKTVVAKDDVATSETVSENISNTSGEATELSNITKGTTIS